MRILQLVEEEKMSQGHKNDINENLRKASIYDSNERLSAYTEFVGEENDNDYDVRSNQTDYSISHEKITDIRDDPSKNNKELHHDSDTESFYNIWGEDDEWLYNNELRNVVRNIHR